MDGMVPNGDAHHSDANHIGLNGVEDGGSNDAITPKQIVRMKTNLLIALDILAQRKQARYQYSKSTTSLPYDSTISAARGGGGYGSISSESIALSTNAKTTPTLLSSTLDNCASCVIGINQEQKPTWEELKVLNAAKSLHLTFASASLPALPQLSLSTSSLPGGESIYIIHVR